MSIIQISPRHQLVGCFLLALLLLLGASPRACATANYVYHERTGNDPGCGGQYVSTLIPGPGQTHPLRFKVEYQNYVNTARVYYTTDGSTPSGSFGTASNSTQIVTASFTCTFGGGPVVDVWQATIPAQSPGTLVKYIISAWHTAGGAEIFANSGEFFSPFTTSAQATLFQYTQCGPTIICSTNITLLANAGANSRTNVTYAVSVTDPCDANPSLVCTPTNGATFNIGATTVSCRSTNVNGNTNFCTFTVTIVPPTMTHRYTFSETSGTVVNDSVGVAHGTVVNPTNTAWTGGKLTLLGGVNQTAVNGYIDLPNGIISSMTNATFEAWVTMSNAPNWQRLFDFGATTGGENVSGNGSNYIFFAGQNPYRMAYKATNSTAENMAVIGGAAFPQNALTHVVCTYNTTIGTALIYINGALVKGGVPITPLRGLNDVNNWLGRAQFNDPYWKGDYLEFRIYEGSISSGDAALSFAAGPDTLPLGAGNLLNVSFTVSNNVMSGARSTQQIVVRANYQNTNNIDITQDSEISYVSSDPNIVSVSTGGFVTALRPGVITLTTTYRGFTDVRSITVLPSAQSITHRYSFNEASGTTITDSIAGASGNGTILGTSFTRANGQVTINTNTAVGVTTYIDLPNGMISSLSNATIEGWATWMDVSNAWQRIFDFGSSTGGEGNSGTGTNSFFLSPKTSSATGFLQVNMNINPASAAVSWTRAFPTNSQTHFAVVYNKTLNTMAGYINGAKVVTITATLPLLQTMNDFNNWLGRSQYNDPYFKGSFNEFRTYGDALLDSEILNSFLQGPDVTIPNSAPTVVNVAPKVVTPAYAYPAGLINNGLTNPVQTLTRVYWGTNDGSTTFGNWSNVVDLSFQLPGPVSAKISGLAPGKTYFYRYYATNRFGQTWAASAQSFTTPSVFAPLGWAYVLTNRFTGYTNAELLVNFPALVTLGTNTPGFSYEQFFSGQNDLRFVEANGGELNYEIESWNTNGTSFVWVQVPEFTNSTAIQMYWGKSGLGTPAYTTNGATWNDGFAGVWHMTNKVVKDSSAHGYDANIVNNPSAVADTNGIIGTAQDYNGALNAYTAVGAINFTNTTLSAWVWCRDLSRQGLFMSKDGAGALGAGSSFFWQQNATIRGESFPFGSDVVQNVANSGGTGTWMHVAWTVNSSYQSFYTNGVFAASWYKLPISQNADQLRLAGSLNQVGRFHNGRLDECRAEWVGRSPAWIRACYLNQSAPASFYASGAILARPLPLTFTSPSVTNIDTTIATMGVRVIADGGNGIDAFGSYMDTTPVPSNNLVLTVRATNAPFSIVRDFTGLTPGGHYYVRAFASNAVEGAVYSPDGEFYTEPLNAAGIAFQNVSNSSMTVSWTPGTGSSGSLVLMRQGSAITALATDAVTYLANAQFGLGSDLGGGTYVVYAGSGSSVNVASLRRNTNYFVTVFSYAGAGAVINYQQDNPPASVQSTASTLTPDVAGQLLIELHSSRGVNTDGSGFVTEWINYGSAAGSFLIDGDATTYPSYGSVSGRTSISFDGGDHLKATFTAPKTITGVNGASQPEDFSVEYWVLNPVIDNEEWLFAWARRGTSPRHAGVGYGTNAAFGAVAHWSTPDMAFGEGIGTPGIASTPVAGAWHYIAVTYDGGLEKLYVDGVLNGQEGKALNIWDGDPVTLGQSYTYSPLAYATTIPFSGSLVGLRVHAQALSAVQVANNYAIGSDGVTPAGAPRFTANPTSRTIAEADTASFSVSVIGSDPLSVQWYRNSSAIPGATSRTYTTPLASVLENGAQFFCVASNYFSNVPNVATSGVATLTVVGAAASLTHRWPFDTDANDVIGTANGTLVNGAAISSGAVTLNGVNQFVDLPNDLLTNYVSTTFEAWVSDNNSGNWARVWDFGNNSGGEGNSGTGSSYLFLAWPSGSSGGLRGAYKTVAGAEQLVEYSTRPSANTVHHIVWTQDGAAQTAKLYVDGVLVSINTAFTHTPAALGSTVNDWLGRSQFTSDAYFNGSISEFRTYNVALGDVKIRENFEMGLNQPPSDGPVSVWKNPTNTTVIENRSATFVAGINGHSPIAVQWFKNGAPISGGTNLTLTFTAALADHNAAIQMWATNSIGGTNYVANSSVAALTVLADTSAPVVLGVGNEGTTSLVVNFSEAVNATTAINLANYALVGVSGPVALSAASLDDSMNVRLTTAPMVIGTNYTLTVSNITDIAFTPNVLSPSPTIITFKTSPYLLRDIGSPAIAGHFVGGADGYSIVAGGSGVRGASDQFTFAYQTMSGDFDVQLRLGSLNLSDEWARAGLMARDGFASNAAFTASFATPSAAGSFFQYRTTTGAAAAMLGSFPVNYPNTWLRLRRVANVFDGFASLDGQSWAFLGTVTIAMPSSVQVGLAVSSGTTAASTIANFRDIGAGSGNITTNAPLAFEPSGPSSRKTALVFTEIMYNPPDSFGGSNNLEWLEIYNSGMVTEDLTGHKLRGDISYNFAPGTSLAPGQFLVVAHNPTAFASFYGTSPLGPWSGNLANHGGTVRLNNELGGRLLEVNYDNEAPWPIAADGSGHSLVLRRPSYGENDPRAWGISAARGGSPGRQDPAPAAVRVVINEFLTGASGFIELKNVTTLPVDITGYILTENPATNRYVFPSTLIPAGGLISVNAATLGFAPEQAGGHLYFELPDATVWDVIEFGAQATGVSRGRLPDGSPLWSELSATTPGSANAAALIRDLVLNEIMYSPISGESNDEYLELFNRGSNTVNLAAWRIRGGVDFEFPTNTMIAPGSYIVIAENLTNLLAKYPQLNATNTFGNFAGSLKNSGERIALQMPINIVTGLNTNHTHVTINEVFYSSGGRWGQWSAGGGSSLELTDPRADNRFGASWADSDESAKAPWTTIDVTNILENGQTAAMINQGSYLGMPTRFEFFMQDNGEALVDKVEFLNNGGANLVANGDFASGITGFSKFGVLRNSFVESGVGIGATAALHLVSAGRGDMGPNKIAANFTAVIITNAPNTGTIRAQVRWLKGSPNVLLRTRGHWMEVSKRLDLPQNLGTPGLPNSRLVANAGPMIADTMHTPPLPGASQAVVVSARVLDPDGVGAVSLNYRVDPATTYTTVTMTDDGSGGDTLAGDGIYSATIPGQGSGTLVAFSITASDAAGSPTTSQFPTTQPAGRECLVRWGETPVSGSLGTYRVWLTASNITLWNNREKDANDPLDATFVYGNSRVIYNIGTLYSGSPFHAPNYNGPLGSFSCDYEINFNPDEHFLGTEPFVVQAQDAGNTASLFFSDVSAQVDLTGNWIGRKLGQQYNARRHVHMFLNGARRGTIYEDTQQPNGDMLDEYFPNDSHNELRKIEDWFEFADDEVTQGITTSTLVRVNKSTDELDPKRYRWTWRPRATGNPDNWFQFTNMIVAVNATNDANYVSNVLRYVDMRNFLRPIVAHHITGDWDSYGYERGKNMYAFKPDNEPWRLLLWDIELGLGSRTSRPANHSIYTIHDPIVSYWVTAVPAFQREYLCAYLEAINTTLMPGAANTLLDERYASFQANSVGVATPQYIKDYITSRRAYLLTQMPASAPFTATGPGTSTTNIITLAGTAPLNVKEITVNGRAITENWLSVSNWSGTFRIASGTNNLIVRAFDGAGAEVASVSVTVVFDGVYPWPQLRINEWVAANTSASKFADPADGDFDDWFEIYNPTAEPVDLAEWFLSDTLTNRTAYQVPAGYVVPAGGYLLVWADNETNQNATNRPDLHANFQLAKGGESIVLSAPDTTIIDSVTFGAQQNNVSQGRSPDGGTNIYFLPTASPRTANYFNTAPALATIPAQQVDEQTLLSFSAVVTDPDVPGQTLTFSLGVNPPSGATINASSGLFSWTPSEAQGPSNYLVTIVVTDNGLPVKSDSKSFTVIVDEVNSAPYFTNNPGPFLITALSTFTYTNLALDNDLPINRLAYELLSAPSGAGLDTNTGVFTWTPSESQCTPTNLIVVRASDDKVPSLSATQSFIIVVSDVTPPVLTLNGASVLTNECHTTFVDPGATASDSCAGNVTSAIVVSGTVNANMIGTYTLTYTVQDGNGNTSSLTRTVRVVDTTLPVLTLNGASVLTNECHTTFVDPGATATDTCAGDVTSAIVVTGAVNANMIGTYTLTYTVSDGNGNTSSLTRTVRVVDTTQPVLTLNGASVLTNECHTTFVDPGATATDTCAGDVTSAIVVSGTVNANMIGTYMLTYTVSDGNGNTSSHTRTVRVVDTTLPVLTLNGASVLTNECHTTFVDPGATATDNCAGNVTSAIVVSGTVKANMIGTYTLTYTVQDGNGNTSSRTRTVRVVDTTLPVLTLNGASVLTNECHTTFVDPGATATDNCAGDVTSAIVVSGTVNDNMIGTYTLTYTVQDGNGNTSSLSRTVRVVDTIAPVVTLIGAASLSVPCHSSFTDPGATANDACSGDVTPITTGSVDVATPGTYILTYSATDSSGHTGSTTRTVTVLDILPTIVTQPASRMNNVGSTASFIVAATSCGELHYQWSLGTNILAGATNATLTLNNVQFVQAGNYSASVSNSVGSVASAVAVLTVNRLPIVPDVGASVMKNHSMTIAVVKLMHDATDPDGDPLTLLSVSATSTNGGSVVMAGDMITYTPLTNFTGVDRFTFQVSDGRGGITTAAVEIFVAAGNVPSMNRVSITPTDLGFLIRFAGVPGRNYQIQRSTDLITWSPLVTLVAPLHGIMEYEDTNPPVGTGFYRTVVP